MIARLQAEQQRRTEHTYACEFSLTFSSMDCKRNGEQSALFTFSLSVGFELADALQDVGFELTRADVPQFESECENFRVDLEDLRNEAEALRKSRPDDLNLYKEIIRFYKDAQTYYSALIKIAKGVPCENITYPL